MLEGHFEGVFAKLIETVAWTTMTGLGSYRLVADVDAGGEAGKVHVYPVGVFGERVEEAAVLYDVGVSRVFKGIGEAWLVECLILVWGEVYFEVAPSFGGIYAITGKQEDQQQERETGFERHWLFEFKIASGWRLSL
jgi:hypothetical protein